MRVIHTQEGRPAAARCTIDECARTVLLNEMLAKVALNEKDRQREKDGTTTS